MCDTGTGHRTSRLEKACCLCRTTGNTRLLPLKAKRIKQVGADKPDHINILTAYTFGIFTYGKKTGTSCKWIEATLRSYCFLFTEYLGKTGVTGQYTGYNAPDDNAYVERLIRTVKEEEIWLNLYDTVSEARAAVEEYIRFYNEERLHSSLGYRPPKEFAAAHVTLAAA